MIETYYNELKKKLEKSYERANSKAHFSLFPKRTRLQLTNCQLQDLLYLWNKYAKIEFPIRKREND